MSKQANQLYEFGPFQLDPGEHRILRDGEALALTPKAFETLMVLVQNHGHLLLKDELMKTLWPDSFVEEVNLSQNISTVRRALGDTAQAGRYIVTVPGKGYRFVGEVRTVAANGDGGEDVIVESHSRSRVVIEEKVEEQAPELEGEIPMLQGVPVKFLPAPPQKAQRRWMVPLVLVVAAACGIAGWTQFSVAPVPTVLRSVRLTHTGRVSPYSRVLTDGSRLFFTQTSGGRWELAEVPVGGGEPTPIAVSLPSLELRDIDATRSKFLIASGSNELSTPIWALSTAGGSAERIGDVVASDGTWSSDARKVLYSSAGRLFAVEMDGANPRLLMSLPGIIEQPRLSPDGRRMRFTLEDRATGGRTLWEAGADGSNPHRMELGLSNPAPHWGEGNYSGDWSPDGKYFLFRSHRAGDMGLWILREEPEWYHRGRSRPIQIYTSGDTIAVPRFSVDGKKIFFIAHRDLRELVRYDAGRKQFVPYMGGMAARHLSYSPDGQWVAYHKTADGTLWRSRADGSESLQLTFQPMFAMHSWWSPDGKTIVFQGSLPGESAKLYSVPAGGGKADVLLGEADANLAEPSWCGDGRKLVYMRWGVKAADARASGVGVLDWATKQSSMIPGSHGFDGAHCSPDGKFVAASDEVNRKLMLYDFARQRWSELSDGAAYGWGIRWSGDSRYVYYQHAVQDAEQPIFRVRISDKNVEQITSSRQILRADVLSYTMTGLAPDNSPVASLVRRNSDIYALELELP